MKKMLVLFIATLVLLGIVLAIPTQSNVPQSDKPHIVGSFYPMTYFASQIVGDLAQVTNITPAGAEPHDYDLSTGDIANMEKAMLIILNGVVEPWGEKMKTNLHSNVAVITAGEGLFTRQWSETGAMSADPHVWLAPVLAKQEVQKIVQALVKLDPSNEHIYQTNAQSLEQRLDQLDTAYQQGLAHCAQKDIITSHAAFGYLAAAYGLNQVSIAGLSPDEEPSPQQLALTAKFVREHQVKYIFFESLASPKLAQTLASETGAVTLELNPLEGLSKADLQLGKDYFTVMTENLHNLQTALTCQKVDHSKNIIELDNVCFAYGKNEVLHNVCLAIHQGDYLGIVGPNGGGKTTVLKIMLGLLHPAFGKVKLFGDESHRFRTWSRIGYVPQKVTNFDSRFPATTLEIVMMGRYAKRGLLKWANREDKARALAALEKVGMRTYADRLIGDLSGGQQQRVFIARALAADPDVLVLDEPTAGIDEATQKEFYQLLRELNQKHELTLILVSHDSSIIEQEASEIAYVNNTLTYKKNY